MLRVCFQASRSISTRISTVMPKRAASQSKKSSTPAKKAQKVEDNTLAIRCIDTIRVLSADTVEKAKSGHPGAPMGCAPIAHVLFGENMAFSPAHPTWANRDRFVLSNGHACALLYSMLHLTGYDLTIDDLKNFRQLGSRTPGHPENYLTEGVEVCTGPLGQGISNAVGIALAEKHLGATFNKEGFNVMDHFTYVICGDGCLQEGVSSEASSLAGHLGLGKLIVCYDDNLITIDGDTSLSFTEDVNKRYEAYGWHVQTVSDVNDLHALREAIDNAKHETSRPSLIKIRTIIGHGSGKEGTESVHGAPLGTSDLQQVKTKYHFNPEEFFVVPEEVRQYYATRKEAGVALVTQWTEMLDKYAAAYPELAAEFTRRMSGELPADWEKCLPVFSSEDTKAVATRNRSEQILNAIAGVVPELIGGSADLTGSNLTNLKCSGDFQADTPSGRYIRFGVREHAMAALCNGMASHGGVRPFCATFLNFISYALGAVRLSALGGFPILYIMTHDSIGLGEDGPTHQPVETLESLRALPNLLTFRPCDGNETAGAYSIAMHQKHTPSVIALTRHGVPTLPGSSADKVSRGAYVLTETHPENSSHSHAKPAIILVSTGSEVTIAHDAAKALSAARGVTVRVVSMPCMELFAAQPVEYQSEVFPDHVPVMSIEASSTAGWARWAHAQFGLSGYGMSAPAADLFKHFGFTAANLCAKAGEVIDFYANIPGGAHSLVNVVRFPQIHHKY